MKRKNTLAALLSACLVLSLAGCSGSDSSETTQSTSDGDVTDVTLKVWCSPDAQSDDYGNWLKLVETEFEKEHPEYNMTWINEAVQEGDIGDTVKKDPEAAADVFLFANDQIGALVASNAIAELGGETLDKIKENNSEIVVDSVTLDGAVYGVPITTNTWFMYYNKSIFSEEDVRSLDTMLEKGIVTFPLTNSWYNPSFFLGDGATMFGAGHDDAGAGVNFDLPEVTEYLVEMVNNPNFKVDADGSGFAAFTNGQAGCMFSGSWEYDNLYEALGDDLGMAVLPTYTINGEEKQMLAFSGSKAAGVNPNADNPKAAVEFASFIGGEYAERMHWELRKVIPCNKALLEDPEIGDNEIVAVQNNTINNASFVQPIISEMANFWDILANFGKALEQKSITLENASEQTQIMQEQLDANLK